MIVPVAAGSSAFSGVNQKSIGFALRSESLFGQGDPFAAG
jgi:hypothetical protein